MAGILDLFTQPASSFYGGLLNTGDNAPNYAGLNPDAGDTDALGAALKGKNDPFADMDKKQKEDAAEEAAKQAALGVFATGAAPVPQAGVSGQQVMQPGPFGSLAPMAPQQAAAPPAAPPIAQGAVPIPQPRPAIALPAAPAMPPQDQAALPPNAQPTQGQLPPQQAAPQAQPQPQEPSTLSKIGNALGNNSNLLLGLGAGLAGAPSIGTGISRGLTGASAGGQLDQKQMMQQGAIGPTYKALVSAGVPPQQALAAVYNPTILKSVTENYLGDRKGEIHMVKDEFGAEHPMIFDPYSKTLKPVSPGTGAEGGNTSASPTGASFLAPGVTAVDQSKVGDEYLNQYSPTVQSAVKDYVAGKSMPTGNPRGGYATQIKAIAQKYGDDVGTPADDTMFSQRRTMRNDLGKDTVSSLGGQITTGEHASDILARMGKAAEDLNNVDVGLAGPSHVINDVRGMTSAQSAKMQALQTEAQHYGQEITKFYSGSPGGEAERNRFMSSIGAAKTPQELASVLEHESELLHDRMTSIEGHVRGTLGDEGVKAFPAVTPNARKSFDQVTQSVGRLRGNAPADAAASSVAPAVPTATGPNGHKIVVQNGRWVDAQTGQPVQ